MTDILTAPSLFKPNRVDTPSATRITAIEQGVPVAPTPPDRELVAKAIRLRLRSVQVMDGLQGIFGMPIGDATGVYLITTVLDGTQDQPIVLQGKTYRNVRNGDMVPLGSGQGPNEVFNVYLHEGEMPRALSFSLAIFRSNEDLRELGTLFGEIEADDRYKAVSKVVAAALTAANPAFGTLWTASEQVIGLIAKYLKAKPDDQLGYYQANYTNAFDNLGVGRHPEEGPPMLVDRIRFAYEINALAD